MITKDDFKMARKPKETRRLMRRGLSHLRTTNTCSYSQKIRNILINVIKMVVVVVVNGYPSISIFQHAEQIRWIEMAVIGAF